MSEKRWLSAFDALRKLIQFVDYQLKYASETLNANVWTTTCLLTCLKD